jgi:hypothetical protein
LLHFLVPFSIIILTPFKPFITFELPFATSLFSFPCAFYPENIPESGFLTLLHRFPLTWLESISPPIPIPIILDRALKT